MLLKITVTLPSKRPSIQRRKMDINNTNNSYQIISIIRSDESLSLSTKEIPVDVEFSFDPYLIIKENGKIASAILESCFFTKDKKPISNELRVQVSFQFSKMLPIIQDGSDKVKIQDYESLLSIFDITVGTFRGILFEWLKDSKLQQPLPCIDIEELIKNLKISFSK